MRALLRIYRAEFKTHLAVQFQYRVSTCIWLLERVLEPAVYLAVWTNVARARGGHVGGFAPADLSTYFIVTLLVNHLTYTWIMWEYEYYIRNGTLSFLLLRPLHPLHKDLAENLSNKALTLVVIVPTLLTLILVFRPALNLSPWKVTAFALALPLAFAVRFLVEWTLATLAFWTTRVSTLNQLYFVALLLFSGKLAPLTLLPRSLQVVATLLPFRWMVAFPVELLAGDPNCAAVLAGLVAQGAWLLLGLALMRYVWRAGVRRYSACGGLSFL
jgi:ABC-2 type transport system permease protein